MIVERIHLPLDYYVIPAGRRRPDNCDGLLCPECAPFGCAEQTEEIPEIDLTTYTSSRCNEQKISTD